MPGCFTTCRCRIAGARAGASAHTAPSVRWDSRLPPSSRPPPANSRGCLGRSACPFLFPESPAGEGWRFGRPISEARFPTPCLACPSPLQSWTELTSQTESLSRVLRQHAEDLNSGPLSKLSLLIRERQQLRKTYNEQWQQLQQEFTKVGGLLSSLPTF